MGQSSKSGNMVSKRVATFAIAAFITLLANVMHLTSSYIVKTDASINAGKVLVVRFGFYGLPDQIWVYVYWLFF